LKAPGLGNLEVLCKKVEDEGWIENNAGVSNGIDLVSKTKYTECVVLKPTGCQVRSPGAPAGTIELKPIETKLVTFTGGGIGDLFKAENNLPFVELEFREEANLAKACGVIPLAAQKVTGQVVARVLASGKLSFTSPPQTGSTLKVGGFAAEYIGEVEQEMEGGGLIEAREEL